MTVCTARKRCMLGAIENSRPRLTLVGEAVRSCWLEIPAHHPGVELGQFVVMPNHLHGILIRLREGAGSSASGTLGAVVGQFKAASTRRLRRQGLWGEENFWQRSFFEHVIRDGAQLTRIERYILENPNRWNEDAENPQGRIQSASSPYPWDI